MKFTELETQDDIDRYQIAQEDADFEAGLKGVGLSALLMAVVAGGEVLIRYAGF